MKRVEDYLSLNYRTTLYRDDEGDYVAEVEGLPGCIADGSTPSEALGNLREAMESWIQSRLDAGLEVYEPTATEDFSGRLLVRLPKYLHRKLTEQSRAEGVSLNQYIVSRLAEVSATSAKNQAVQLEQHRRALAELERSYDVTLEVLADAQALKLPESANHSKRVTAYTIALARTMGLKSEAIRVIARAAFLHDIGSIATPENILNKQGSLNQRETSIMREHAARGAQLLSKIPFLKDAATIVYGHHEHFDGHGYPRGLRSDAIPLGARIISLADAFDVMTSDKPYRKSKSLAAARNEIVRQSGRQFDPKIVQVFLSIRESLWGDLRSEIDGTEFAPSEAAIEQVCALAASG